MKHEDIICSQDIERKTLSGLLRHPEVFIEVARFIDEKDFVHKVHSTIFNVLKSMIGEGKGVGEPVDKSMLVDKIISMNVRFKDEIDIPRYISDMGFSQAKPSAIEDYCRVLKRYSMRREYVSTLKEGLNYLHNKAGSDEPSEIVGKMDALHSEQVRGYTLDEDPIDVFENIADLIEDRRNNPVETVGLATPWSEFNYLYGGLREGNIYSVCSRAGHGKTTWINELCLKTAFKHKIPCLMLDTEVETIDIQFRMAAAVTGCPVYLLETGKWARSEQWEPIVRAKLPELKKYEGIKHVHVANKDVNQISAIARRWYMRDVGRGNPCMLAYDYIKLTGEKVSEHFKEYQVLSKKIDTLHQLAKELHAPLIVAMQLNKKGEGGRYAPVDDSSAFAATDSLQSFSSFTAIFRRKTNEEFALDGEEAGTHKMIVTKARFQGEGAMGHDDRIRRRLPNGSIVYQDNYLNFQVHNFEVEERGSLRHIVARENERFLAEGGAEADGEILP